MKPLFFARAGEPALPYILAKKAGGWIITEFDFYPFRKYPPYTPEHSNNSSRWYRPNMFLRSDTVHSNIRRCLQS